MKRQRRQFSADWKAKIAWEAIKGGANDPRDCLSLRNSSQLGDALEKAAIGGSVSDFFKWKDGGSPS
jgi:hypothetical protein